MPLLSILMPVYNEAKTIKQVLEKINSVNIDKEIIIVDDGSTDGSEKLMREIRQDNVKIIFHSSNRGKGAAVLTALENATGEFIILQDADLEYDPQDYIKLMEAMRNDGADIVLGVRFTKGYSGLLITKLGNRVVTSLVNILFGARLNDFLTCYKLLRRDFFNGLKLESQGFDIEAEIIAKILKRKLRIKQVPISYHPRDYRQGKKIRWLDGIRVVITIAKFRISHL